LLSQHQQVVGLIPPGRPPDKGFEHTIEMEGAKPKITTPYRHPRRFKDEIERAIKELLAIRHTSECVTCQQNKSEKTLPIGLLQPLPISEQTWESLSIDLITSLPKAQGKDDIFVGVDRLTKFACFLSIPTYYNAMQEVELFFRETFRFHGLPQIDSATDSRFINTFWQEVFRFVGIELTPNTSYHP
jgi:hypothetical protein